MNAIPPGAIDCDIHPGVPSVRVLLPYMDAHWADAFVQRGMDGFDMASYPPGAPITCRPDWRLEKAKPGTSLAQLQAQALDAFGARFAICNPLYGGQVAVSETMAAALTRVQDAFLFSGYVVFALAIGTALLYRNDAN